MKKFSDVIGLPLLGILEGQELGKVSELIVDARKRQVKFVVIDLGEGCLGLRLVDLNEVTGIGADFVTVRTLADVTPLWEFDESTLETCFSSKYLIGAKVIACEGNLLGEISELTMDELSGEIKEVNIVNSGSTDLVLSGDKIVAFSKNQVFVDMDGEKISPLATRPAAAAPARKSSKENQFELEQRQYLLGRIVSANVLDDDDKILIRKGSKVTNELIDLAKSANRLMDLTLNVD